MMRVTQLHPFLPKSANLTRGADQKQVRFGIELHHILNDPDADRYVHYSKGGLSPTRIMDMITNNQYTFDPSGDGIMIPSPPKIEIPTFTWDKPSQYGIGSGNKPSLEGHSEGTKKPYKLPISELAKIIGANVKIDHFLRDRAASKLKQQKITFDDISKHPPGRKNMRKTLQVAFRRSVTMAQNKGEIFDPAQHLSFERKDFRYDVDRVLKKPRHKLLIINIRDYSGSMDAQKNDIVKKTNFLETSYLKYLYGQLQAIEDNENYTDDKYFKREGQEYEDYAQLYILHDTQAFLTSPKDFFENDEGGGTRVASAYHFIKESVLPKYPPEEWNIFINHYSDGDVVQSDAQETAKLQKDFLDEGVNLITYTEVGAGAGKQGGLGKLLDGFNQGLSWYRSALITKPTTENFIKVIQAHYSDKKSAIA